MNKLYVKKYDENGTLLNPINGKLITEEPNRKQRREPLQGVKKSKYNGVLIMGRTKYRRFEQFINGKQIKHLVPCN